MERGIITTARKLTIEGESIHVNGSLSPACCRYYALYWDKIAVTYSRISGLEFDLIDPGISDDLKILAKAGIVRVIRSDTVLARITSDSSYEVGLGMTRIGIQREDDRQGSESYKIEQNLAKHISNGSTYADVTNDIASIQGKVTGGRLDKIFGFTGKDFAVANNRGLAEIATKLTKENPGQWAIHPYGSELFIPKDMSKELMVADFELSNCLPVPSHDYPLDKLLDFKLRRRDELIALRESLDDLYLDIAKTSDIPRSKIKNISRLQKAIDDINAVAKTSWKNQVLASRKVTLDLNYGSITRATVAGLTANTFFQDPYISIATGAISGIVSSMKFEVSISSQLESAQGKQLDLSYVSSVNDEGIVN